VSHHPLARNWFVITTFTDKDRTLFWDVAPCNMVEIHKNFRGAYCALGTSEVLVSFYQSTQSIFPEDSHLHTSVFGHPWVLINNVKKGPSSPNKQLKLLN
jgi:hypothetical protein